MSEKLIHIGYAKTATTWFQKEFYPKVQNYSFIPRITVKDIIIKPNIFQFDGIACYEKLINDFGEHFIICEELLLGSILSGGFNLMHTKLMGERIKQLFPQASIIIFIRSQPEIIVSDYGQFIKDGGTASISEYLFHEGYNQMAKLRSFSLEFLKYDQIIDFYKLLFNEKVYVYLYEDFAANSTEFIQNFTEEHKLVVDISQISFERRNVRPQNLKMKLITNKFKFLRHPYPSWVPFINKNKALFYKRQSTQGVLGKYSKDINTIFKESNNKLIEKHGLAGISKYNYPL
jgi:hypothetical protein